MKPRWFVKGDLDGFVGLFIDNLLQLLLIATLCPLVCGIPASVVVGTILPGAAVSVVVGNFFYSWQAWRLAKRTGRDDVTALPYGINTVSLIAFIFFVMGPVWRETGDPVKVWQAGVFACLISGAVELACAFVIDPLRRSAPRAALLAALAGIALTFIAMGFAFQIFASPLVAVVPMFLMLVAYAGRLRLPLGLPAGFVAIVIGVVLAWGMRWAGWPAFTPPSDPVALGFHPPRLDASALQALAGGLWGYLTVIIPMALFTVIGSLQTLESAEAAGDRYETRPSLVMNGVGTLAAAFFGSPFPTTIYIGHPGWKAMGARIGYSALNGLVVAALCFVGAVSAILHIVPMECTLGILIWIGIVMVAQAFQETPKAHALAVAVGFLPALAAWAVLLIETALRVAGTTLAAAIPKFGNDLFIRGALSLNQGFLVTSMAFAALVAFAIDRRFLAAAATAAICAALSFVGLIHAWTLSGDAVVPVFGWNAAPAFSAAYLLLALFLVGLHGLKGFDPHGGGRDSSTH